jgi:hypothetical protein
LRGSGYASDIVPDQLPKTRTAPEETPMKTSTHYLWFETKKVFYAEFDGQRRKRLIIKIMGE